MINFAWENENLIKKSLYDICKSYHIYTYETSRSTRIFFFCSKYISYLFNKIKIFKNFKNYCRNFCNQVSVRPDYCPVTSKISIEIFENIYFLNRYGMCLLQKNILANLLVSYEYIYDMLYICHRGFFWLNFRFLKRN